MAEGTGGRGRWAVLGVVGVAALAGLWIATRAPEVAPAPAVAPVGEARPSEAAKPEVPAPVAPVQQAPAIVAPVVVPAEVPADPPAGPARTPTKGKKTVRDGGTNRPPTRAPTKTGGDPPLKPDVYDD